MPRARVQRVERLDDGQRVARSGVARGVSAVGARDVDVGRLRSAAAARRDAAREPQSVRRSARLRERVRSRHEPSPPRARGLARRQHVRPLPHADQLRRQRAAAERRRRRALGRRARARRSELQSDVERRHGSGVCDRGGAAAEHRFRQGRRRLHGVPQRGGDERDAVPQLRALGRARLRAGVRNRTARRLDAAVAQGHPRRAGSIRPEPRIQHRRRIVSAVAARRRNAGPRGSAHDRPARGDRGSISQRRLQNADAVRADGRVEALRLPSGVLDAGRILQRMPRRHQPVDDQEPGRQMGWRLSDRADVRGVVEQPVRGSAWEPQLRSGVQARLPDVPHAAGLRAARHGQHVVSRQGAASAHGRSRGDRRAGANLLHASLHRRQCLRHAHDRQRYRRGWQRPALSRAVGVQFLVVGREERLFERVLGSQRTPRRRDAAGTARMGSVAQRSRSVGLGSFACDGRQPRARPRVGHQQRQRSQLPDRISGGARRVARGAGDGSGDRPPARHLRFPLEAHVARRRRPHARSNGRSQFPGLRLEDPRRIAGSLCVPVQGGRQSRRRLPDARSRLRGAAQSGDQCPRPADRREERRHRPEQSARPSTVPRSERQRRCLRRRVPARYAAATAAARRRHRVARSVCRRHSARHGRSCRRHRGRVLPVGRSDRRAEISGQPGGHRRRFRPRAVCPRRSVRRPYAGDRARGRRRSAARPG